MANSEKKSTDKKLIIFTILLAIVLVLIMIIVTVITGIKYSFLKTDLYIFDTIDDLDFLDEKVTDFELEDKRIGNLQYNASKTVRAKYKGKSFDVFAYDFATTDDAIAYAEKATGKNVSKVFEYSQISNGRFGSSYTYMFVYHKSYLLVISQNKVLYMNTRYVGGPKAEYEFVCWMMDNLPTKVDVRIYQINHYPYPCMVRVFL